MQSALAKVESMQKKTRGCIFGRNWDKNLKTFGPRYSQSSPPTGLNLPPPHGFLGHEISTATAESRWGLGFVYNFFFYLPIKAAAVLLLSHKNAPKPNRKPYPFYDLIAFCRKTKTKVENLKS
jgi:hypothetical protein